MPGGVALQNAEVRQTHVQTQMERQGSAIMRLTDLIQNLERRLEPVLRGGSPATPDRNGQIKPPQPSLVGHATAISNQNDQLDSLTVAIEGMLDRLEL